jgi:hypothetical protein
MIWGNKRGGVQVSKASHVWGSGDMVKNGVQQDDTEQGRAYWEYMRTWQKCRSGGSRDWGHVTGVTWSEYQRSRVLCDGVGRESRGCDWESCDQSY